jgi:hypothetical protein
MRALRGGGARESGPLYGGPIGCARACVLRRRRWPEQEQPELRLEMPILFCPLASSKLRHLHFTSGEQYFL